MTEHDEIEVSAVCIQCGRLWARGTRLPLGGIAVDRLMPTTGWRVVAGRLVCAVHP